MSMNISGLGNMYNGINTCRLPRLLTQQGLTTIERVDDAG